MEPSTVELRESQPTEDAWIPTSEEEAEGFSLPPADGGKDAWLCLLACFMLEALIWGFPSCYGILEAFYSTHEPFVGSGSIATVGACAMGIMYMDLTIIFAVLQYFPGLRKYATPFGLVLTGLSLGLASLSTSVTHLILTQGILYSVGGGIAWAPILFYLEQWWVQRRGFAYGVTIAGLGLSGTILPIILSWLLNGYGFRTTLRVCAIAFCTLTFPIILFFKPRVPLSQVTQRRKFNLSFWKNKTYLILQTGNVIQSLGYFLPSIYLPTFARTLGASPLQSILTTILQNLASFVGCLLMGMAADRYHVTTCLMISAVGSTLSVFLLWGFSTSLPLLYVFCIIYGAFAGCTSSAWSGIIRETKKGNHEADSGMVFACLSAGKGVGNLCSGPLSEALLKGGAWRAGLAYGSGYGGLIVFTGTTAFLGGWGYLARRVGWL